MAKTNKKQLSAFDKKLQEAVNLLQQGRSNEALGGLIHMVKLKPKDYRVHDCMCIANSALGRHAEAVESGTIATQLQPQSGEVRHRFAKALQHAGELERALVEYERALYHIPDNIEALRGRINTHSDLGNYETAQKLLKDLEKKVKDQNLPSSKTIGIYLDKARLSPKTIPAQEVIDDLVPIHNDESLPERFRIIANFQLGRLYETLKDYDNAFKHFTIGNELKHAEWSPEVFDAYIDKLIKCWNSVAKIPTSTLPINKSIDPERLIFIVGMMRSGTSMTEQMIAQIPDVTPGGEMNAIARAPVPFEPQPNPWGGRVLPITKMVYSQRIINEMAKSASAMYNEGQ